jgi:hypothetical protein
VCRHIHCDDPNTWQARLNECGFEIERWWHYFSPNSLHILEWGHYFGLPSLVLSLSSSGGGEFAQEKWNFVLTNRIVKPVYDEADEQPAGVYTFYIVRKKER